MCDKKKWGIFTKTPSSMFFRWVKPNIIFFSDQAHFPLWHWHHITRHTWGPSFISIFIITILLPSLLLLCSSENWKLKPWQCGSESPPSNSISKIENKNGLLLRSGLEINELCYAITRAHSLGATPEALALRFLWFSLPNSPKRPS